MKSRVRVRNEQFRSAKSRSCSAFSRRGAYSYFEICHFKSGLPPPGAVKQTVTFRHDPRSPRGGAAVFPEAEMFKTSFRAMIFAFFASLVALGATSIPAGAFQTGKDLLTVALILTVNSLS